LNQSKDDASTTEQGKAFQMSQVQLLKKYLWALTREMMFIQFILVSSRMS